MAVALPHAHPLGPADDVAGRAEVCPECNGTGEAPDDGAGDDCAVCDGYGWLEEIIL